jgi:hypothetical protein
VHIDLLSLSPGLLPQIHHLVNDGTVSRTWRSLGRYIPGAELETFLGKGVALTAIAAAPDTDRVLGLLELTDYEPTHGHAHVSVLLRRDAQRLGLTAEATILFLDECFARFRLRIVYFLLGPGGRAAVASSINRLIDVKGVLDGHALIDGAFVDVTIAAVTREQFGERVVSDPVLSKVSPSGWRCEAS